MAQLVRDVERSVSRLLVGVGLQKCGRGWSLVVTRQPDRLGQGGGFEHPDRGAAFAGARGHGRRWRDGEGPIYRALYDAVRRTDDCSSGRQFCMDTTECGAGVSSWFKTL